MFLRRRRRRTRLEDESAKTAETQHMGFSACLGHSNWTICSLLSQFCSEIFPTSDFHTPEAISFITQEEREVEFSQPDWDRGVVVCGPFKKSELQPSENSKYDFSKAKILSQEFPHKSQK